MASVLTQRTEFRVNGTSTTQPVLLCNARPGVDYFLLRVKTAAADLNIGALVAWETDDLDEVDFAYTETPTPGIIPDTAFNRRQIEANNSGSDWTYALLFASGAEIDVIMPINNLVCRGVVAASQALTPRSLLKTGNGTGLLELAAGGDDPCGRSLVINTSGSGNQVIAFVLFGSGVAIN